MKRRYFFLYLFFIIFLFLSAWCEPTDSPVKWEYSPKKAGVEVLLNETFYFNDNEYYPKMSTDENFVYVFLENKIIKLNKNNLTINSEILIDPIIDLSVDMDTYKYVKDGVYGVYGGYGGYAGYGIYKLGTYGGYAGYGMITHNNKIVIYNHFVIMKDDKIIDTMIKYLQMDKDGNNKKLLTFNEVGFVIAIDYNVINEKVMMFSIPDGKNKRIVYEYSYNNATELYTFDNSYDCGWDTNRYNGCITWGIYQRTGVHGFYGQLYKYRYEYGDGYYIIKRPEIKDIKTHYLHVGMLSDIAIDGDYLWLLSEGWWDKTTSSYCCQLMKVKPL